MGNYGTSKTKVDQSRESYSDDDYANRVITETRALNTLIDVVSASVTYTGWARIGTATSANAWRIQKLSVSGTVTSITWADGNTNFDNVWNNRASLTYS